MTEVKLEVTVNEGLCGGTSECVRALPALFSIGATGKAAVIADPSAFDQTTLRQVAWGCPTSAISLMADGEEIDLYPG
jgi:ferredoxin